MDDEYIISEYLKDGLLFELIVSQVGIALAESGEVGPVTATPQVRITKVEPSD